MHSPSYIYNRNLVNLVWNGFNQFSMYIINHQHLVTFSFCIINVAKFTLAMDGFSMANYAMALLVANYRIAQNFDGGKV